MESYIHKTPSLRLLAKCANVPEMVNVLDQHRVDLIFLDIQMPEISGIEFARSYGKCPMVIFTTAHPAFAVDAFDLNAVDYLLKPVSEHRFQTALERAVSRLQKSGNVSSSIASDNDAGCFFVKAGGGIIKLFYDEILYVESLENYVKFVCETRSVVALCTMKSLSGTLPAHQFLRIHRSYIVNVEKAGGINNEYFIINGQEIKIGRSYRKCVRQMQASKIRIRNI
jgi:DNA-binding LytR/AlgR family response regulator